MTNDPFSDLKNFIRDTFTEQLYLDNNIKPDITPYDRNCRGASQKLYKLILDYSKKNPDSIQIKNINIDSLEIVSGMAHTFVRGKSISQPGVYFYIDPTIAQFIPELQEEYKKVEESKKGEEFKKGIFVGSVESLIGLTMKYKVCNILDDYIAIPGSYPPQLDLHLMNEAKSQLQLGGKYRTKSRTISKKRKTTRRRRN